MLIHLRNLARDVTLENLFAGIITAVLGCTGPALLVLDGAAAGHLSSEQLVSWMFAIYFFGGLFSIVFPLVYKLPITGAHSISTAAFLATSMAFFSFSEFVGAYILSGLLIFILGITGVFERILTWIPREIISAMLAGMVSNYVVKLVPSVIHLPVVGSLAIIGFILAPKISKKIPAVIGALVFGSIGLGLFHPFSMDQMNITFMYPELQTPTFSLTTFLSISLPVALLVLSNDAAQGIGALRSFGYHPPVTKVIAWSGVASMTAGIFGGHCANIAGMMTALCAGEDAGPKDKRYVASVISGIGLMLFGVFSWFTIGIIEKLPSDFIRLIGGFALSGVLLSSLQIGFSASAYRFSTLFAFIIALSNINLLNISAPVWSLLFGSLMAKMMKEGKDNFSLNIVTTGRGEKSL